MNNTTLYNNYIKFSKRHQFENNLCDKLIIDGTNLFVRNFSAMPTVNEDGYHIGASVGALQSLGKLIRDLTPKQVHVVFDGSNGSKRRKQLYPEYKAGRSGRIKQNFNKDGALLLEDADAAMKRQFVSLNRYLQYLPVSVTIIDFIEADDVIAYMAQYCQSDHKVIIASSDKDYLQLINDNINIYNIISKDIINHSTFVKKYEIIPKNYIYLKCLLGDGSDNIPGIYGIGMKTILKKIPQIIDSEINSIDELINCNKALLEPHADLLNLNFRLMQLLDVDISVSHKSTIIDIIKSPIELPYEPLILKEQLESDLAMVFTDYDKWLNNSFKKLLPNVRINPQPLNDSCSDFFN